MNLLTINSNWALLFPLKRHDPGAASGFKAIKPSYNKLDEQVWHCDATFFVAHVSHEEWQNCTGSQLSLF